MNSLLQSHHVAASLIFDFAGVILTVQERKGTDMRWAGRMRRSVVLLSVLMLLLLALGCEDDGDDGDNADGSAAEAVSQNGDGGNTDDSAAESSATNGTQSAELPFDQVALSYMFDHEQTAVIRTQEEWEDYLAQASPMRYDTSVDAADANCDFSQNMLVAHSFGVVQADFEFQSVEVTAVTVEAGRIIVNISVDVRNPTGDGITMPGFTYEGVAVRIPQSDLPVEVVVSYH